MNYYTIGYESKFELSRKVDNKFYKSKTQPKKYNSLELVVYLFKMNKFSLPNGIVILGRNDCPYCTKAKKLADIKFGSDNVTYITKFSF